MIFEIKTRKITNFVRIYEFIYKLAASQLKISFVPHLHNKFSLLQGYTTQKHPSHQKLHKVAKAGVDAAFSETGVKFDASQSGASLYVAAGGSDDYAIDIGIPYAYTLELGAEELGFSVPPEYLNQTLQAGFIAIKGMVQQVIQM